MRDSVPDPVIVEAIRQIRGMILPFPRYPLLPLNEMYFHPSYIPHSSLTAYFH